MIDVDEFERAMYHESFQVDSDMQKWDGGCWIRYKLFENVLSKQKIVNTGESGRWEKLSGMMPPEYHGKHFCSWCGRQAPIDYGHENLSPWCPWCGAKMVDGGNDDAEVEEGQTD